MLRFRDLHKRVIIHALFSTMGRKAGGWWPYCVAETDETMIFETETRLRLCVSLTRDRDWDWESGDHLHEIETETETLDMPYTRSRLRLRLSNLREISNFSRFLLNRRFGKVSPVMAKLLTRDRDWDWDSGNPLFEIETETETSISRENRDETRLSSVSGMQ